MKLAIILLACAAGLMAQPAADPAASVPPTAVAPVQPTAKQSNTYGFQAGTVMGVVGGGFMKNIPGKTDPALGGGIEVGVHKYIGVFAQGNWAKEKGQLRGLLLQRLLLYVFCRPVKR
ncbi:MAG TPA: hypothetical protein VIX19_11670 [Terriglobales bacterium]